MAVFESWKWDATGLSSGVSVVNRFFHKNKFIPILNMNGGP